jgi:hypothetical protein
MSHPERARVRYQIARALLVYGLVALAAFIPLAILTWGRSAGGWIVIYFLSGLVALAASTALGALNLSLLRRTSGSLQSSRDVE